MLKPLHNEENPRINTTSQLHEKLLFQHVALVVSDIHDIRSPHYWDQYIMWMVLNSGSTVPRRHFVSSNECYTGTILEKEIYCWKSIMVLVYFIKDNTFHSLNFYIRTVHITGQPLSNISGLSFTPVNFYLISKFTKIAKWKCYKNTVSHIRH